MIAKILTAAPALILAFSLTACASAPKPAGPAPATALDQFAVKLTHAPEEIALAVHPQGLSVNQQTALSNFVSRWRDNGEGDITVRTPTGGGAPAGASRTAEASMGFLVRLGVPARQLRMTGYDPQGAPGAPVFAGFERFEAEGPDCTQHWDDLTATRKNDISKHFGCATTANLAAQIANPRDLVVPAATDPSDNSRREVVLGKYRQGQITSSVRDDQASGQVSGH